MFGYSRYDYVQGQFSLVEEGGVGDFVFFWGDLQMGFEAEYRIRKDFFSGGFSLDLDKDAIPDDILMRANYDQEMMMRFAKECQTFEEVPAYLEEKFSGLLDTLEQNRYPDSWWG